MTNTNEIGFDGRPRYRTEARVCTSYHATAGMCGASFDVTYDRHALDMGPRTCPTCRRRASVSFHLTATDRDGSPITVLDGTIVSYGVRNADAYAMIRRWVASAAADGVRDFRLSLRRHTPELGSARRRVKLAA